MPRWLLPAVFGLLSAAAPAAEELEQLDAEFLEYLAHLEGDDDDWTLIAAAEQVPQPADTDAEAPKSPSKSPSKTPTPAEQPAVDER